MEEKREMNLFELIIAGCNGLKTFFKSIVNLFCQTVRLSLQYFWIVGLVVAGFCFIALFITKQEKRVYKSHAMITFSKEIKPLVSDELQAINAMRGFEFEKFAELMNLSHEQAKKFKEVRYYQVIDFLNDSIADVIDLHNRANLTDTLNRCMSDRLGIRIYLKGSTDFRPYYRGLVNYFNKNKDIARIDSASKMMIAERIAFCDKELQRLDKFSDYDYFEGSDRSAARISKKGEIRIESTRKQLYYIDMRDLLREKNYLTNIYASNKNVINVLSENPALDIRPRWHYVVVFAVAGYIFGIILALMFKRRKQIWNYIKDTNY